MFLFFSLYSPFTTIIFSITRFFSRRNATPWKFNKSANRTNSLLGFDEIAVDDDDDDDVIGDDDNKDVDDEDEDFFTSKYIWILKFVKINKTK